MNNPYKTLTRDSGNAWLFLIQLVQDGQYVGQIGGGGPTNPIIGRKTVAHLERRGLIIKHRSTLKTEPDMWVITATPTGKELVAARKAWRNRADRAKESVARGVGVKRSR